MSCKCSVIQGDVSGSYKIKNWYIEYTEIKIDDYPCHYMYLLLYIFK